MDSTSVRDGTPPGAATVRAASTTSPVRGRARVRRARRTTTRVLRDRWDVLLVISAGGAVGSLARWSLTLAWPSRPGRFPWATLAANLTGCLLLGALMILVLDVWPPSRYLRPFLGVGVLGGYTTFSTAMLDTRAELVSGHQVAAGEYLFGSLVMGLVAVWIGMASARLAVVAARGLARRHVVRNGSRSRP